MPRTTWFRGLILVLVLVLVAPTAFAAEGREPAGPSIRTVLSALWHALVELIPAAGQGSETLAPVAGTDDSGPGMDPNG